ncbi:unnamed protein product [Toxocara canis]|uniref:PH domain-containing protein n=1 Tax=Toxocara canis TaxID=6265 RepID=A0A183V5D7_TOXCA|nr:unnamed protein product [Toxocara canis]
MEKMRAALMLHSLYIPKKERLAHVGETVDSVILGKEKFVTEEMLLKTSHGDPAVKRRRIRFKENPARTSPDSNYYVECEALRFPEFLFYQEDGSTHCKADVQVAYNLTAAFSDEDRVDMKQRLISTSEQLIAAVEKSQNDRERCARRRGRVNETNGLEEPILANLYASPLNTQNVAFQRFSRDESHQQNDKEYEESGNPIGFNEPVLAQLYVSPLNKQNVAFITTCDQASQQEADAESRNALAKIAEQRKDCACTITKRVNSSISQSLPDIASQVQPSAIDVASDMLEQQDLLTFRSSQVLSSTQQSSNESERYQKPKDIGAERVGGQVRPNKGAVRRKHIGIGARGDAGRVHWNCENKEGRSQEQRDVENAAVTLQQSDKFSTAPATEAHHPTKSATSFAAPVARKVVPKFGRK